MTALDAITGGVSPQMVTLARLSRGLTQDELAQRLGIKQGTVSKIEAGVLSVSPEDLAGLVAALSYPESFFMRREMVDGPGLVELYHARKRKTVRAMALHRAYAVASIRRMHVETLLKSYRPPDERVFPLYPADEFGDPERVARTVRAHMELPPGPIFNVTDTIERAGGIVIECDFESRQIDGFTRWRRPTLPPLFFINRNLPPDRWRWTLAHELGHAVMHTMQDLSGSVEPEADAFAQEFLMPRQYIRHHLLNLNFSKLAGLKTYWKVSIQALIMRAHSLGLLSPRQRSHMFMQWSRAGYKLREPEELDPLVERPSALSELVAHHLRNLGYSVAELAQALSLLEFEFRANYLPGTPPLRAVK